MNALRLPAFAAALVLGTISAHADTIKQRPLTIREMTLEAARKVREQARDLARDDFAAKLASGEISEVPGRIGPSPSGQSSPSGSAAGKR